jgi:hypothetical protein
VYALFSQEGAKWIQSGSTFGRDFWLKVETWKENAVHSYGNSAVQQAQTLTMTLDDNHRAKQQSSEEARSREEESPTLAGYIVYVTTVLGFLTMCVLSAFR